MLAYQGVDGDGFIKTFSMDDGEVSADNSVLFGCNFCTIQDDILSPPTLQFVTTSDNILNQLDSLNLLSSFCLNFCIANFRRKRGNLNSQLFFKKRRTFKTYVVYKICNM